MRSGSARAGNGGGGSSARATAPLGAAQLAGLAITMADFEVAVAKVQPSVAREGFSTKPDVTWADVVRCCSCCVSQLVYHETLQISVVHIAWGPAP